MDGCCCHQLRQRTQEDEQQVGEEDELSFGIVERRYLRDSQMETSKRPFLSWRSLEGRRSLYWKRFRNAPAQRVMEASGRDEISQLERVQYSDKKRGLK